MYVISVFERFYTSECSKKIAYILQDTLREQLKDENKRQPKSNDTYYLLQKTTLPVVIVECGFLSNAEDTEKLVSSQYQQQLAAALAEGIKKSCNTLAH